MTIYTKNWATNTHAYYTESPDPYKHGLVKGGDEYGYEGELMVADALGLVAHGESGIEHAGKHDFVFPDGATAEVQRLRRRYREVVALLKTGKRTDTYFIAVVGDEIIGRCTMATAQSCPIRPAKKGNHENHEIPQSVFRPLSELIATHNLPGKTAGVRQ